MTIHVLSVLAFIVASFATQAVSHFVLNKAHYDTITFARADQVIWMGVSVMIVQGILLSVCYATLAPVMPGMGGAVMFALGVGLFLGSYIALVEPAKYQVPSIARWVRVEGLASLVQFVFYGILLGLIYQFMG